jgi:ribonuclease Y
MSKEEVKKELVDIFTEEAKVDAAQLIRKIEEEAQEEAEKRAKRIVGIAIQRFAGEYVAEQTIGTVELPNDEIKGRLIGREGRNIRAFEQICGVDLVIDDTPGLVVISSFNVVRKEIARITIERLIADGRIHPAKIEEFYEKAKVMFDSRLRDLGEKAQMEIGIHGIHPEILKMFGALNWRTSYMQNQYQHSLEVAFICGAMAAELGINVKQARRAGLLHDIGKVMDASQEGSHAMVGADFLKKYGESPDIVHAVRAHHEDVKPETLLAHLVMAADAISGGRPGVRKFLKESYVTRLSDIESIVNGFEGVSKSYAISAGREIRVLVENEKINDEQTVILSRDIAKKIEEEMSYPGSIKVSVIRETRAVGFAR